MYGQLQTPKIPQDLPRSWEDADRLWRETRKRRWGRALKLVRIENGTVIVGVAYAVRLYETDVVTFHADDSATLNSGTWQTPTSRSTMCACGFNVSTHQGVVSYSPDTTREYSFRDGMRVAPDGAVTYRDGTPGADPTVARVARRQNLRRDPDYPRLRTRNFSARLTGGNTPEGLGVGLEAVP